VARTKCHTVPRCIGDIFRAKKAGDLFVPKKANLYRLIEKFDPKQRRILAIALGENDQFHTFLLQLIFPTSPSERPL